MDFGGAGEVARERVRILQIALQQRSANIATVSVARGCRVQAPRHPEKPELREGRRFEFLVRENLGWRGMIERDQLHLIQIRNLVQFFRNAHFVNAIALLKGAAGDLDVLVVIHGKVRAVAKLAPSGATPSTSVMN